LLLRLPLTEAAAWAGIIGPVLFIATFTVEGWLRPGYNPRAMFISALSLGPRGRIQIVNFIVFGALFLLFARGVAAAFPEGKASSAGPVLLTIIGISFIASGLFAMDPMSTPRDQMSLHGMLHSLFGALVFSLAPASCFVFLRRFCEDPNWQPLQWWTLAAGAIMTASVVLLKAGPTQPPAPPNAFNKWNGAIQRTALIPYLIWVAVFGYWLLRSAS
jgi:hypothetical membrane protein